MRNLLLKCPACNIYTLEAKCKKCGNPTVSAHPAKFSLEDKYLLYRIAESHTS